LVAAQRVPGNGRRCGGSGSDGLYFSWFHQILLSQGEISPPRAARREGGAHPKMIRDIEPADYAAILELNLASVEELSPLGLDQLAHLVSIAAYSKVYEDGGSIGAFILALTKCADYNSPNYIWFSRGYHSFLYIDRIVVRKDRQRKGIGELLYSDLTDFALQQEVEVLACEINISPPNPVSLRFHQKHGFYEVGTQWIDDGKKQVAYLVRRLIHR
jgi:predicted GNAT superfamily acetyltransferase